MFLFNSEEKLLLQQRSNAKITFPGVSVSFESWLYTTLSYFELSTRTSCYIVCFKSGLSLSFVSISDVVLVIFMFFHLKFILTCASSVFQLPTQIV